MSKTQTRAERIAAERKALQKSMRRCGVHKSAPAIPISFPDLSTAKAGLAPLSNRVSPNGMKKTDKKIAVPDGYFIGHSHKQGLSIMPKRELEFGGGKKT